MKWKVNMKNKSKDHSVSTQPVREPFKDISWVTFRKAVREFIWAGEGTVAVSAFAQAVVLKLEHIRLTWTAHRLLGPSPRIPQLVGQRWVLTISIFNKSPGDAAEEHRSRNHTSWIVYQRELSTGHYSAGYRASARKSSSRLIYIFCTLRRSNWFSMNKSMMKRRMVGKSEALHRWAVRREATQYLLFALARHRAHQLMI